MLTRITLVASLTAPASAGLLLNDGDFANWTYGSFGTATPTVLASGGNPGARLQSTTVSGSGSGVLAIYVPAVDVAVEGISFSWSLDVLRGPGSFGQGQAISMIIQQGDSIFLDFLYITGVQSVWTTQNFNGTLNAANFTRLTGTGSLNLSGAVSSRFGFAASNSSSGTLTQYYDNWSLQFGVIPAPGAIALLSIVGLRRRRAR
ncbi:MAG: hypothetical protein FJ285_08930 [Planctomycetes bacterium]|nr:hypothetical protein [Planctomycetota bacterium]